MIEQVMDLRADEVTELTTADRAELLRYEAVIKRGIDAFVAVGNALLAIRRDRLYRATHATFEAYCVDRWQITYSYANKLMGASKVADQIYTSGVEMGPESERQIRPLTKLPAESQAPAWTKAIEDAGGGQPTPAQVTKAAANFAPKREPKAAPVERLHKPTPIPAPEPATPTYIMPVNNDFALEMASLPQLESPTITITLERVIAEKLVAAVHVKALWRHLQEQEMIVLELVLSEALEP